MKRTARQTDTGQSSSQTQSAGAPGPTQDAPPGDPAPVTPPASKPARPVRSWALVGLFLIAMLWALHFARPVLVPIFFSVLLAIVLNPPIRWLSRFGIPAPVSAFIIIAASVSVVGFAAWWISAPALAWAQRLPEIARELEEKTRPLRDQVAEVEAISGQVGELVAGDGEADPGTLEVVVRDKPAVARVFVLEFGSILVGTALIFVVAFFILASGDSFLRKLVNVIPRLRQKVQAVNIVRDIQHDIALYFSTITVVNVALGIVTGVAMGLMGLPNALLWGIMAGLFNYVPYLGSIVGTAIIGLVASAEFETIGPILWSMGLYYGITIFESNLITPFVLGKRMTLNPVMVFGSLMFWGWLWGLAGVFLAIPILAIVKIIGDRVPTLSALAQFIGK